MYRRNIVAPTLCITECRQPHFSLIVSADCRSLQRAELASRVAPSSAGLRSPCRPSCYLLNMRSTYRRLSRRPYLLVGAILLALYSLLHLGPMNILRAMTGSNKPQVLTLDGSTYEGGGGLIRYAIAYAGLLHRPVHIDSIRANRPGVGGLRPEHTVAIATMSELTSAIVTGNLPASREMTFMPHADSKMSKSSLPPRLDVIVEGSASIFLIAMLPYLLFSNLASKPYHFHSRLADTTEFELTIRAGTLCVKAPSIFYIRQVFLPTMELIGVGEEHLSLSQEHEQGWHTESKKYPGKMVARIKPLSKKLPGFILEHRGHVRTIRVTAHAPKRAMESFKQMVEAEMEATMSKVDDAVELIIDVFASIPDDQYHLLMVATTAAPAAYIGYEQVYPQSDVFDKAWEGDSDRIAIQLIRSCIHGLWTELRHGNAVDEHMEDILVMYQSLATGFSSVTAKDNQRPVPEIKMEAPAISEWTCLSNLGHP